MTTYMGSKRELPRARFWVALGATLIVALLAVALLLLFVILPYAKVQTSPVRYENLPRSLAGYMIEKHDSRQVSGPIEHGDIVWYSGSNGRLSLWFDVSPIFEVSPVGASVVCYPKNSILSGRNCFGTIAERQIQLQVENDPDWQATEFAAFQELTAAVGSWPAKK